MRKPFQLMIVVLCNPYICTHIVLNRRMIHVEVSGTNIYPCSDLPCGCQHVPTPLMVPWLSKQPTWRPSATTCCCPRFLFGTGSLMHGWNCLTLSLYTHKSSILSQVVAFVASSKPWKQHQKEPEIYHIFGGHWDSNRAGKTYEPWDDQCANEMLLRNCLHGKVMESKANLNKTQWDCRCHRLQIDISTI